MSKLQIVRIALLCSVIAALGGACSARSGSDSSAPLLALLAAPAAGGGSGSATAGPSYAVTGLVTNTADWPLARQGVTFTEVAGGTSRNSSASPRTYVGYADASGTFQIVLPAGTYTVTVGNGADQYSFTFYLAEDGTHTIQGLPAGIKLRIKLVRPAGSDEAPGGQPTIPESGILYVAGAIKAGALWQPVVWRDGEAVLLERLDETRSGFASAVSVSGADVYAAGYSSTAAGNRAVVWKNGVATVLPTLMQSGFITDVVSALVVVNGDVYVGGASHHVSGIPVPVIWKNGVLTELPRLSTDAGLVNALHVSGATVYAAGQSKLSSPAVYRPVYWQNGVINQLTPLDTNENAWAFAIARSDGGHLYVGGAGAHATGAQLPATWKDGTRTDLQGILTYAKVAGLSLDGTDVYAAGTSHDGFAISQPVYWKNGSKVTLTSLDSSKHSQLTAIVARGGTVYAAGNTTNAAGVSRGATWINGSRTDLPAPDSSTTTAVNSIYVVER